MECAACGSEAIPFRVPEELRRQAPGEAATLAICSGCLSLIAADAADAASDPDFSRIVEGFPHGEMGATMALAVGLLVDSLALNREAIVELFERVIDRGVDPWTTVERLAVSSTVDPDADLDRLRRQLEQLVG